MFKLYSFVILFWLLLSGQQPTSYKAWLSPHATDQSMCHPEPTEMADFAGIEAFGLAHPTPEKCLHKPKGKIIKLKLAGKKPGQAYLLKAKKKTDNWLFVYQEWWGLNDHIKKEAEKYYDAFQGKVNVIAIDLYDGKIAVDRVQAAEYMKQAQEERLIALVQAAQSYAGKRARIASVGWCFGGAWSIKSALITGNQNIGCVIYYGMPVREVERLRTLNSDVLGIFATEEWISQAIVEDFAMKMQEAGKQLTYKIFPGPHGFANPSNPKHDPSATKEAFEMTVNYLDKRFALK